MPDSPKNQARIHAPLLWLLTPTILGYLIASASQISPPEWTLVAAIITACMFLLAFNFKLHNSLRWRALGTLALIALAWSYFAYRHIPQFDWGQKPEREAILSIKITQITDPHDKYQRLRGLATITQTPKHLQDLIGQNVHFFLKPTPNLPHIIKGQTLQTRSTLRPITPNDPFEAYLQKLGIHYKLERGSILKIEHPAPLFQQLCHSTQLKLQTILNLGSPENSQETAIYSGMLLGKKAALSHSQKDAFKRTGSLHLFAISGLHVGVIAAFLAFLLAHTPLPKPYSAIIGLLTLFTYIHITGAAPSAMRAFLMVAFYWSARAFYRKSSGFSALLASALLVLIIQPTQLFNLGFQLSYAVVGTILLYGLPLTEQLTPWAHSNWHWSPTQKKIAKILIGLFAISLAANIGSAPLTLLHFNTFAPGAIPLSMILVPLASAIIITGCASLLIGLTTLTLLPTYINKLATLGIQIMETLIHYSLKIPLLFMEKSLSAPILAHLLLLLIFIHLLTGHARNTINSKTFYTTPILLILITLLISPLL